MKVTIKRNSIALIFWIIALVAFAFQCYNRQLATLIVPCLAIFLILELPSMRISKVKGWLQLYSFFIIYLCISLIIALVNSGVNNNSIRFFIILAVIPLAGLIEEEDFNKEWITFKIIMIARVIPALYKWIQLLISQDYTQDRLWARQTGAGDIYIINGIPRVQLVGSSLFVMAFLIDLYQKRRVTPFGIIMIIGALITGNSAYVLGIVVGIVFYLAPAVKRWMSNQSWKILILIPLVIIGMVLFTRFSISTMNEKSSSSNLVRTEQAEILLNANPLVGNGLGHEIYGTVGTHIYDGTNSYFELQTLYIFNQIGIIGLLFFYILTISLFLGKDKRMLLFLYLTYLIYTFFNPYCFDSTQIITVIMISNVLIEE